MKKLIYAAYGSNLLKERFMVYINGGCYEDREYVACRDKTEPEDLGWMLVPHRLYFAKESPRWDKKGVAFLSYENEPNSKYHAVVRLWKISEEQFKWIHENEGKGWYNIVLSLGEKDGLEIKAITGRWMNERNAPSQKYLEIIKRGLKETTKWDDEKIKNYLDESLSK